MNATQEVEMSKMFVVAVAVVAALLGSALTFGFGSLGSVPVQAAQVQAAQVPVGQGGGSDAPVARRQASFASAAPYTQAVMESRLKLRFSATDANRDGFVSRSEIQMASDQARTERRSLAFGAMDSDKNGSVSRAEFDAHADARRDLFKQSRRDRVPNRAATSRADRPGFIGTRQFERMDADKDGRVSLGEALASSVAWFQKSDIDRDGRLSAAERKAARRAGRGIRQQWRGGEVSSKMMQRENPT
jgi:EF hand